jgi:GT2 family glycosyltransferase
MPMRTALVIPSLGGSSLRDCLDAVDALDPAPDQRDLVLSGGAVPSRPVGTFAVQQHRERLGFAAAVNAGLAAAGEDIEAIAILNDDATPDPGWLGALAEALALDSELAAVQGTIQDASGRTIDGRGIMFDVFGLPIQIDRGLTIDDDRGKRNILAASGTASLFRVSSLKDIALPGGDIFDPRFGCYHEDLDLGLRLRRRGWRAAWVGGAGTRHIGSSSAPSLGWRHPWWLLANRWRALAGNLSPRALFLSMPRLLRGEARAIRSLSRTNPRALVVAGAVVLSLPGLIATSWRRPTPGSRLEAIPDEP